MPYPYNPEYYRQNKEKIKASAKKWRKANLSQQAEYQRNYARKNPEIIKAVGKKWRNNHPEKYRVIMHQNYVQYYPENKEKFRTASKKWKKNNPQKVAAQKKAQKNISFADQCCEICQSNENLVRHHPDYSTPLSVEILCHKCHMKEHRGSEYA